MKPSEGSANSDEFRRSQTGRQVDQARNVVNVVVEQWQFDNRCVTCKRFEADEFGSLGSGQSGEFIVPGNLLGEWAVIEVSEQRSVFSSERFGKRVDQVDHEAAKRKVFGLQRIEQMLGFAHRFGTGARHDHETRVLVAQECRHLFGPRAEPTLDVCE